MKILFDLQVYLSEKPVGELICDKIFGTFGEISPTLIVEQVEDVKVIRITNRKNNHAGIMMRLSQVEGIKSGDRFTVVGRQMLALHGARFALFSSENRDDEIVYNEPKNNIYSLSFTISDMANNNVYLSTTKAGVFFSGMDFFVDGILVVNH